MFGLLSTYQIHVPAIFMTATMRHPDMILSFCGLRFMDEELFESPMRPNLEIEYQPLEGHNSHDSHRSIMAAAVAAIKQHAPSSRVAFFVMFKSDIDPVVRSLRQIFPNRYGFARICCYL